MYDLSYRLFGGELHAPEVRTIGNQRCPIFLLEIFLLQPYFGHLATCTLYPAFNLVQHVHAVPGDGLVGFRVVRPNGSGLAFIVVLDVVDGGNDACAVGSQGVADIAEGAVVILLEHVGLGSYYDFGKAVVYVFHRKAAARLVYGNQLRLVGHVGQRHFGVSFHVGQLTVHICRSDEDSVLGQHTHQWDSMSLGIHHFYLLRLSADSSHQQQHEHHKQAGSYFHNRIILALYVLQSYVFLV